MPTELETEFFKDEKYFKRFQKEWVSTDGARKILEGAVENIGNFPFIDASNSLSSESVANIIEQHAEKYLQTLTPRMPIGLVKDISIFTRGFVEEKIPKMKEDGVLTTTTTREAFESAVAEIIGHKTSQVLGEEAGTMVKGGLKLSLAEQNIVTSFIVDFCTTVAPSVLAVAVTKGLKITTTHPLNKAIVTVAFAQAATVGIELVKGARNTYVFEKTYHNEVTPEEMYAFDKFVEDYVSTKGWPIYVYGHLDKTVEQVGAQLKVMQEIKEFIGIWQRRAREARLEIPTKHLKYIKTKMLGETTKPGQETEHNTEEYRNGLNINERIEWAKHVRKTLKKTKKKGLSQEQQIPAKQPQADHLQQGMLEAQELLADTMKALSEPGTMHNAYQEGVEFAREMSQQHRYKAHMGIAPYNKSR